MAIQNGILETALLHKPNLMCEMYADEPYQYYPLGKYIVAAPGVCGGRPTFKYTRLQVSMILTHLAMGETVEEILNDYAGSKICAEAIYEAIDLAKNAFLQSTEMLQREYDLTRQVIRQNWPN